MTMPDSKIIGLINGISKDNALQYGSTQIDSITASPTGNAIRVNFATGDYSDIPISSFNFMFKNTYDTNNNSIVDKSEKLQLKDSSNTFMTGEQLLSRKNHTDTQDGTTVTLDKTNLKEFFKDFQGTTVQSLVEYLDTHKEFINGILIGDSIKDGSFRIQNVNSKLEYQRLENGVYKTIGTVGSYSTDVINLNSPYSTVNFKTSTKDLNLARITTDGNSVQIGDVRLDRLSLSGKELYSQNIEDTKTSYDYIVNNNNSLIQSVSNWEFTVNIPSKDNYSHCTIYAVETNNTTTGYYKYTITDVLTNNIVYYTCSDFELKQGLAYNFTTTGLHTETLPKLIHLTCGRQYKITFTAQSAVGFKGSLVGSTFKPYLVFKYYLVEENELLSQKDVTDSVSSNSSKTIASSKAVYTLSQAINSISGGLSPVIPISPSDFSALKKGVNGTHYILTSDGAILSTTVHKYDNIFMVNTFGQTTTTERNVLSTDYVIISANPTPTGHIYITNIEALTNGKNVTTIMNDYPNQGSVKSALSDDSNYRVFVEWDRGAEEFCGQPTVCGKDVVNIEKLAGSYTGYVDITSTDIIGNKIVAILGQSTYTIAFSIVTPPTISSITFGNYPTTNGILQTELKEGDVVDVTIVTDKPIDTVEFQDTGAFQYQTISVTNGTTIVVQGLIANRGETIQDLTGYLRVKSTEGSWSSITSSIATLKLNNIKPSMTFGITSYPNGQLAIKGTESATLNYTLTNTDICTPNVIGNDLNIGTQSSTSLIVTRLNTGTTTYNDGSINNISFKLIKNTNGSSITVNTSVAIVTVAPILLSQSNNPYNIMSGNGIVINTLTFSQKVKVKSISALSTNAGTLSTGTTTSYSTTYGLGISSQDTDIHSNTANSTNIIVTGLSGLDSSNISVNYYIRGFANKVLTFVYNSLSQAIGTTVVDVSKLVVNGFILTSPAFEICKTYENNPTNINNDTADYYSISVDKLNLLLPSAVKQFGYATGTNIQVNISEVY